MFHVGLSGYSYRPWQGEGRFYPVEIKPKDFFGFYAKRYRAVEMDGTWYRMPSEKMVAQWGDQAPRPFFYCPKMHRDVTHRHRMKEDGDDSAKFFLKRLAPASEAGVLGPVLIQLPPNLKVQADRLQRFLDALPNETESKIPYRFAVEFRNETWESPDVERILRERGVAWVASDTDEKAAVRRDTAEHSYIRLRKTEYDESALNEWAEYFRSLRQSGREVFVFCKHEDDSSPWIWADALRKMIE